jgi:hypothetical protein
MRHEQLLLSEADSRAVIDEVNAWCRRTGTNYNKLVTAARVAPCIRSVVRHRGGRMTIATARKFRDAMEAHRYGISKGDHKTRVLVRAGEAVSRQRARHRVAFPAEPLRVDRSPCPRCGARRDIGCVHTRFESSAYA